MHPDKRRRGRLIRKTRRVFRRTGVAIAGLEASFERFTTVICSATEEIELFSAALDRMYSSLQLKEGALVSSAMGAGDPTYSGVARGTEAQEASRG